MTSEVEFDLGIRCDYLLTMSRGRGEILRDAFVGIRAEKIVKVSFWLNNEGFPWSARTKRMIHARDQVVMPGLINGHTHLAMSLLRGLADDLPFDDWLHRYILPTERKLVSPEFVRIGTELAALEAIRSGTTSVCDMYFFSDVVAEVLDRAGMRGLVAEAITTFPTPDNPDADSERPYRILDGLRKRFSGNPRILPASGPHAPYSCSDEMLKAAADYSVIHGLPLVSHVAETRKEVQESLKEHGKTPVRRLYDLGVTQARSIFAHGVHLNEEDISMIAESGVSVIYNPESNMKLGAGVAPIPKLLQAGVKVGIGSDGSASNNDLGLFKEMDAGAKLQKLSAGDNTAMTALQALRFATIDGARALGLESVTGSIEEGKYADLAILDLRLPHLQPIHDLLSQLVYSATGQEVSTVICHGRILMENREFKTLDPERIYGEVAGMRDKIQASLA